MKKKKNDSTFRNNGMHIYIAAINWVCIVAKKL